MKKSILLGLFIALFNSVLIIGMEKEREVKKEIQLNQGLKLPANRLKLPANPVRNNNFLQKNNAAISSELRDNDTESFYLNFNLEKIDPITNKSFMDLIREKKEKNLLYILAVISYSSNEEFKLSDYKSFFQTPKFDLKLEGEEREWVFNFEIENFKDYILKEGIKNFSMDNIRIDFFKFDNNFKSFVFLRTEKPCQNSLKKESECSDIFLTDSVFASYFFARSGEYIFGLPGSIFGVASLLKYYLKENNYEKALELCVDFRKDTNAYKILAGVEDSSYYFTKTKKMGIKNLNTFYKHEALILAVILLYDGFASLHENQKNKYEKIIEIYNKIVSCCSTFKSLISTLEADGCDFTKILNDSSCYINKKLEDAYINLVDIYIKYGDYHHDYFVSNQSETNRLKAARTWYEKVISLYENNIKTDIEKKETLRSQFVYACKRLSWFNGDRNKVKKYLLKAVKSCEKAASINESTIILEKILKQLESIDAGLYKLSNKTKDEIIEIKKLHDKCIGSKRTEIKLKEAICSYLERIYPQLGETKRKFY